jgi:hypothetical protein
MKLVCLATTNGRRDQIQFSGSLVFRLELAQPRLNGREEMGIETVRTTQFGMVTRQTGKTPCVQVEASINLMAACGTYKL